MSTSLLLSGLILSFALLLAWAVVRSGRKAEQSERKMWWLSRSFVVGGIVFAVYVFFADYSLSQQTLFEDEVEGTSGLVAGDPVPVRALSFEVEHPGVTHTLRVWLVGAPPAGPTSAAEMDISVEGPGREMVLDESAMFQTEERRISQGSGDLMFDQVTYEWARFSGEFIPSSEGLHELSITIRTAGIARVHVLITDPLKTDGKRMQGY